MRTLDSKDNNVTLISSGVLRPMWSMKVLNQMELDKYSESDF